MTEREIWFLATQELMEYLIGAGYGLPAYNYVFNKINPLIRGEEYDAVIDVLTNWHIDMPKTIEAMKKVLE